MSSPQASTVVGSDDDDSEPAQVPSPGQQGTQYDDRKFVKELLEACSNKQVSPHLKLPDLGLGLARR